MTFLSALAIRLIGIGSKSFWSDEGASWANAIEPVQTILGGQDIHPPGYYLLLHWMSLLSESEFALRLPSALASAAATALILVLGWRLFGSSVGIIAGALSAVSPLDVWYAQDARQPALAAFAVLLGAYGLARRDLLGSVVAAAALAFGLVMDYVALAGWALVGGVWTYFCWRADRRQWLRWLLITAPVLLAFTLLLGRRFEEGTQVLGGASQDWYGLVFGSPIFRSAPGIFVLIYLLSLIGALIVHTIIRNPRTFFSIWLPIIAFALLTVAMGVPRAYSIKKILIVGWPLVLLLISHRLAHHRLKRAWALYVLLALSITAVGMNMLVNPKEDWRSATARVQSQSAPGEVVWVSDVPWAADTYLYYGGDLEVYMAEEPDSTLSEAASGVWLFASRWPRDPIPPIPAEGWFDTHWRLVEERAFDRLVLKHYVPTGQAD